MKDKSFINDKKKQEIFPQYLSQDFDCYCQILWISGGWNGSPKKNLKREKNGQIDAWTDLKMRSLHCELKPKDTEINL